MQFTADAKKDLFELYRYVCVNDSQTAADSLSGHLEKLCEQLCNFPARGHFPPELESIGVMTYREVHYKSYRVIYDSLNKMVTIHCIFDGRRDLQELLLRRILR